MTRRTIMLGSVALIVVIAVAIGVWLAARPAPEGPQHLDAKATSLREKLGPLCADFDFQLKEKAGEGVVRPIHCERRGSDEVHLKLYVFSDEQARKAWQETHLKEIAEGVGGQDGRDSGPVVVMRSEDWIAAARGQDIARQVGDRLFPDSIEGLRPAAGSKG